MAWQLAKREAGKASPTSAVLLLPVVPHVGETDTDTLTEIPGRPAEAEEEEDEEVVEEEEVEDEFGYSWSEFMFLYFYRAQLCILLETMVKYLFCYIFVIGLLNFTRAWVNSGSTYTWKIPIKRVNS